MLPPINNNKTTTIMLLSKTVRLILFFFVLYIVLFFIPYTLFIIYPSSDLNILSFVFSELSPSFIFLFFGIPLSRVGISQGLEQIKYNIVTTFGVVLNPGIDYLNHTITALTGLEPVVSRIPELENPAEIRDQRALDLIEGNQRWKMYSELENYRDKLHLCARVRGLKVPYYPVPGHGVLGNDNADREYIETLKRDIRSIENLLGIPVLDSPKEASRRMQDMMDDAPSGSATPRYRVPQPRENTSLPESLSEVTENTEITIKKPYKDTKIERDWSTMEKKSSKK